MWSIYKKFFKKFKKCILILCAACCVLYELSVPTLF